MPTSILKNCFEEKDSETSLFIKKYCGIIEYDYIKKHKDLTIALPENNKLYGTNSLYCEYTIHNYDEIKSIKIHSKKKWGKLYMKIEYLDSMEDKEIILGNEEKYNIYKSKNIKIIFESKNMNNISPFSIKISNSLGPFNIAIIILIIVAVFILFIIIILCYIYIKKKRKNIKTYINNNNENINIKNDGYYGCNTERNDFINYINQLKIITFKDIKDKSLNNKCPFEMELFDDNSEVIFTSCQHSFHIKCLKAYLDKNINIKELKCFLCNYILYKGKDNNLNTILK